MCGIFALINNCSNNKIVENNFIKGKSRGPEFSILKNHKNIILGFHRLAINGLNTKSNQPFEINNCVLICNGEIYNFQQLAFDNNVTLETGSDCEIILHLYKLYGIEYTIQLLDGVFAFILYDIKKNLVFVGRDPYGVRPLYYFYENNTIGFASEIKSLYTFPSRKYDICNFIPGHYMILSNLDNNINIHSSKYSAFPCISNLDLKNNNINCLIVNKFVECVKKRVIGTTERPIGCLLSGGLDSSLVACLVNDFINKDKPTAKEIKLNTFSIGLEGSEDLKYAKIVAQHINSNHHEIIVSETDFFNAIPEVIEKIESFDTTTVRASVGNYLVAKYIKENSDCKVIFNGDGADELMGGYLYFKKCQNAYSFDSECKRLLNDIYKYDVLRSDRSISSNGLEPRTPFLDKQFVEFYLSIDKNLRYDSTVNNCEKYLIRKSFSEIMPNLVPESILWRTKEAFSDGVSSLKRSWFEIIKEKIQINKNLHNELDNIIKIYKHLNFSNTKPLTYEQAYYKYIYNKHYRGCDNLIPYYWMPRFIESNDASARTLNIYNEENNNIHEK
tara:strand:+ start:17 stop:1693 length:1677 start_codon:yes stop_codon:yes gene_type:complete